jgi:hypothetical protein
VDLDDVARKMLKDDRLRGANWEGLGWYEDGRRLVLVHDKSEGIPVPVAFVIDLQEVCPEWL